MQNLTVENVRYNAAIGAFQARVDIERCGTTYRYPCEVKGPITMGMNKVRRDLARHASKMSDSGSSLMSRL